jgi:hypothetical protein
MSNTDRNAILDSMRIPRYFNVPISSKEGDKFIYIYNSDGWRSCPMAPYLYSVVLVDHNGHPTHYQEFCSDKWHILPERKKSLAIT